MLNYVKYQTGFIENPDTLFKALWTELGWERRGATPRREYYCNEAMVPYVYGRGAGMREYLPNVWHPALLDIKRQVESALGTSFEVAFLNSYENAKDHLGWHADDSPEMDDDRAIAIVTLGAEREIWFRKNPGDGKCSACNGSGYYDGGGGHDCGGCGGSGKSPSPSVEKLLLENGSLCVMAAGMQDTHQHRIPKVGFECGPRISITFRGYKRNP